MLIVLSPGGIAYSIVAGGERALTPSHVDEFSAELASLIFEVFLDFGFVKDNGANSQQNVQFVSELLAELVGELGIVCRDLVLWISIHVEFLNDPYSIDRRYHEKLVLVHFVLS